MPKQRAGMYFNVSLFSLALRNTDSKQQCHKHVCDSCLIDAEMEV